MYFFQMQIRMNSNGNGIIRIQEFIEHCTGPVPEELKSEGWQGIKRHDGDTLHVWIKHHCGENIPQELFYNGWQTDKDNDGRTPLMIWIEERPDEAIP